MQFLDFLFYVLIGWALAKIIVSVSTAMLRQKNEQLKEELIQVSKELSKQFILVSIEKYGEVMYLFEKGTDRFIAQGKNKEELMAHCKLRFPGVSIITDEKQAGDFNL
jgi:Cu/Ag efflux pump CusA